KGDKVTTTTEVLLELPFNEHLTSIMDDMKQDEPVKDMLRNVISDEFRVSFKTHYWGLHCNSTDGEVVCPAWMVPPSEVAHPTLVLGQDDAVNMFKEIKFKGVPILYSTTFLKFNDEEETPVVVKRI
ncbi:unnamed protein product, partial [Durusdinium trenchii]